MQPKFISAINQICEEKSIPKEIVIETVEAALAAAYKKDFGERDQEVRVKINEETGEIKAYVSKEVVEEVENENLQIILKDAKNIDKKAKVGDIVEIEDTPTDFGRIAAQTAKQVIIQRIREAERDIVFAEYKGKEGDLINANVQRIEGNTVIVDLGHASGVLFSNEQVNGERYYIGQRLKVYIVKVEQSNKGPQVVVSRSHPGLIRKLFEIEVPEIESDIVIIKSIAREAGYRTKTAVTSTDENVDPVGSCVGQKGIRVQSVMSEIGEEKIDVISWSEDTPEFIKNALSPAKVSEIKLVEADKKAIVKVPEDQLSLAIGKNGQNVRLAAKLTGWNIDIGVKEDTGGVEAAAGEIAKVKGDETEGIVGEPEKDDIGVEGEADNATNVEENTVAEDTDQTDNEAVETDQATETQPENIIEETLVENPQETQAENNQTENIDQIISEETVEATSEVKGNDLEQEVSESSDNQVNVSDDDQIETAQPEEIPEQPEQNEVSNQTIPETEEVAQSTNEAVEESGNSEIQNEQEVGTEEKMAQDILNENDENNA